MPKYNDFMDISNILKDYSNAIYDEMEVASKTIAKDGMNTLKQTSPKRTGKYRKSWVVTSGEGIYKFYSIIHNKKYYRLTHLLENPHSDRTGRRTIVPKSSGLIRKVEQQCINEYEKECIDIIKKESR